MSQTLDTELLSATASDLQKQLHDGTLSSVTLVKRHLAHITAHNHKGMSLHALISTAPRDNVLAIAHRLDDERAAGRVRGPLHGIPIVLKDAIITDSALGMDTTCGAHALVGAVARRNATIAQRLIDAGAIILGKANLTQFCGLKMQPISPGYSPVGGQTQSPYVAGGLQPDDLMFSHSAALGSSGGSAVAVAAGFAPLAIGTETAGSLVAPSVRAGLYSLKCTHGGIPVDGVWALCKPMDCLGGMAKTPADLADLTEVIQARPAGTLRHPMNKEWSQLRIGFCDPIEWRTGDDYQKRDEKVDEGVIHAYEDAIERLRSTGAKVVTSVSPGDLGALSFKGKFASFLIAFAQIRELAKEYFANYETVAVRSLEEMIKWNDKHPELEFTKETPGQSDFIACQNDSTPLEEVEEATAFIRQKAGVEGIDKLFDEQGIDLVVAPGDSALCIYSSYAGYPVGTSPIPSYIHPNGRPFGVQVIARAGQEALILRFMAALEDKVGGHPLPKALLDFKPHERTSSAPEEQIMLDA